jgi:hypothetical protein
MDKTLGKHTFAFNPNDNGGEALVLTTEFVDNGDREKDGSSIFLNQELTLHSYCNSASFNLSGAALTPDNLRKLANELESAKITAISKMDMPLPQTSRKTIIVDTEEQMKKVESIMIQQAEFIYVRETMRVVKDRYGPKSKAVAR